MGASEFFKTFDINDVAAYRTAKVVKIKDFRLGLLHFFFIVLSLVYVFYWIIYRDRGYGKFDQATGSVQLALNHPEKFPSDLPDYCDASCATNAGTCNCEFFDAHDLVYPEEEEYSIFVGTKIQYHRRQQSQQGCNGDICTSPWTSGEYEEKTLIYPNKFDLKVSHFAIAPTFYQEEVASNDGMAPKNPKYAVSSKNLWGQIVDTDGKVLYDSPEGNSDQFPLNTLIKASGQTYSDSMREEGAILRMVVLYGNCEDLVPSPSDKERDRCSKTKSKNGAMNYYQYQVTHIPRSKYYVTRVAYDINEDTRTVRNMTGIRVISQISGVQVQVSAAALLQSAVTLYIFLSVSAFVVDLIVLYILPGRKLYAEAKYEKTENFTDLRKNVMNEQNLKKKIDTLVKMARYQTFHEVEDLLNTVRDSVGEREYDEMVLACVEVYAVELRDVDTANNLITRLNFDSARIKANMQAGQFREAYLIAVKIGSKHDVQEILAESEKVGNERLIQLCTQYLSNLGAQNV